ncbi:MAG: betaine--homocysteine S-methyltransferase [Nitratireductor sp.]|nr:betaine--homocysteine S-methyltransferase [Nitratireductor sp.]
MSATATGADDELAHLLALKGVLLADGAAGTNLFGMGLAAGEAPELWNESSPDKVRDLHRGFVEAGADIILTNSFGGTRQRLKLHNAQDRVFDLNRRAGELAREIADGADHKVLVAGSVGPTGELMVPLGALTHDVAVEAFIEQMEGLKAGGVDLLWIETMSSPDEIRAAAEAAGKTGLPYVFTASFDTAGKTMMGLAPGALPALANELEVKPDGIGANCGVGASDLLASILDMSAADPDAVIVAKANCGMPEIRGDQVVYNGTPQTMSEYACLAIDAGARIIGGCCGTTCEHLKAMRTAIDHHVKGPRPGLEAIETRVGPMINTTSGQNDEAPRRERRGRRRG